MPLLDAVVLAAGASSRMGYPKALARVGSDTFLERIVRLLSSLSLRSIRIVLGPDAAQIVRVVALDGIGVVHNPNPESGPLASLRLALDALDDGGRGVLVWPVDHPLVQAETVQSLLAACAQEVPAVVQPISAGAAPRPGHPVIFAARLYPALRSAPLHQGARSVVFAHRHERLLIPVPDPHIHSNIDTREGLQALGGTA